MATSGQLVGSNVLISGHGPNYFFVNWQLASQNAGSNFSTINWQAYFHFTGDDAELDAGQVNSNVGLLYNNGGRVYNYAGNFTTRDLLIASGTFNIGHNNDGTQSLSLSDSMAVFQSGTSSGSASWALPTIDRTPAITSFFADNITPNGFTLHATTDRSCSSIAFSDDNGSSYTGGGSGTSGSLVLTGLKANTVYNCYVYGIDSQSGIQTFSGLLQVTTKPSALFTALDI